MKSKKVLYPLIVTLGICIGAPIAALSGLILWGVICGITTIMVLDIALIRPYPAKMKLVCLGLYAVAIIAVVNWTVGM